MAKQTIKDIWNKNNNVFMSMTKPAIGTLRRNRPGIKGNS
jgi:hypothetical protein